MRFYGHFPDSPCPFSSIPHLSPIERAGPYESCDRTLSRRQAVRRRRIGSDASGLQGIRSDNLRLAFDLDAGAPVGVNPQFMRACRSGPEVSE